jgi:hypothetical protein
MGVEQLNGGIKICGGGKAKRGKVRNLPRLDAKL